MTTTTPTHGRIPTWTLGDRLRKARLDADITTSAMARALGVDRKTVCNYESERTRITRGNTLAWALITGVSSQWIMQGDPPPEAPQENEIMKEIIGRDLLRRVA